MYKRANRFEKGVVLLRGSGGHPQPSGYAVVPDQDAPVEQGQPDGTGVLEPAELDALRGAGTLVTVGPDGPAHALADLAVVADPESVLRRLNEPSPSAA